MFSCFLCPVFYSPSTQDAVPSTQLLSSVAFTVEWNNEVLDCGRCMPIKYNMSMNKGILFGFWVSYHSTLIIHKGIGEGHCRIPPPGTLTRGIQEFSKNRRLPPPTTTAFVAFPRHHQPPPLRQNTPPPNFPLCSPHHRCLHCPPPLPPAALSLAANISYPVPKISPSTFVAVVVAMA